MASSSSSSSSSSAPKPVLVEAPGSHSSRELDGHGFKIAIVSTRWYDKDVVGPLVRSCKNELQDKGVRSSDISHYQVAGAYELPFIASRVIQTKHDAIDAVICIGCMVKGGTMAYEFVSEAVTMGLMKLNVMTDTPVVLGLLTCSSDDDAKRCASAMGTCLETHTGQQRCNHGVEWAQEALQMARLKRATAIKQGDKSKKKVASSHCKDCQHGGVAHKTARGEQENATCVGCGQSAAQCDCKNCNCGTCANKQERQQGEMKCGGCGHRKDACDCQWSHSATGVTTTRTGHAMQPEREPGVWP
ncbi:hypothetical protein PINS_up009913 [Pythium insidiosum]|nr:hypothetical protein PINS_up009913 [Pythium insidiosum]